MTGSKHPNLRGAPAPDPAVRQAERAAGRGNAGLPPARWELITNGRDRGLCPGTASFRGAVCPQAMAVYVHVRLNGLAWPHCPVHRKVP